MFALEVWNHLNVYQAALFVVLVSAMWIVAGALKTRGLLRTGDARKLNHITVLAGGAAWFNSGDPLQDRVSCHAAAIILFTMLLLVCHWRDWGLCKYAFVGYARETDRPHDGFHVWFSWLVSLAGLEFVDVLFGSIELTRCAALVLGLADAVGEPIGSRFGNHRYFVRDILGSACRQRSWEGSLAVALVTSVIMYLSISSLPWGDWQLARTALFPLRFTLALAAGATVSLVEAWTPHGLDNLTIPISAAVLVQGLASLVI